MNSKIKKVIKLKGDGKLTLRETLQLLVQAYEKPQFVMSKQSYYLASREERSAEYHKFQQYIPPAPFGEGEFLNPRFAFLDLIGSHFPFLRYLLSGFFRWF